MAKRDNGGKRTSTAAAPTTSNAATAPDPVEERVVAFAEQLGRMVGTVQAKAEGWMDRDALNKQIASVRDGAAELLEQLSDGVTTLTGTAKTAAAAAASGMKNSAAASGMKNSAATSGTKNSKGRSGGVVDAPGKKHRKPMPHDSRAMAADAKTSNIRAGKASMKTMKTRGRG